MGNYELEICDLDGPQKLFVMPIWKAELPTASRQRYYVTYQLAWCLSETC